jgi:hypothetical protein
MQSEKQIRTDLTRLEKEMAEQLERAKQKGFPILFWDANCVERKTLRRILGMRPKPFCAADTMAGW